MKAWTRLALILGSFVVTVTPLRADVALVSAEGFRHPDGAEREKAKKERRHHGHDRSALSRVKPTATGSVSLIDNSGLKFFINTNITFSTSSSASAAASEASFTHSIAASTSAGGTVMATLNDMFDGYGTICVSLTNATGPCLTGNANYTIYNKKGAAVVDPSSSGRQYVYNPQTIGGLSVSRKVFVPTNDNFIRWMNIVTNTTGAPTTFTMITSNNLGSDTNTRIVSSSSGDNVVTTADKWVTSFQNYSGNTSTDPRIAHVLWGAGASVPVSNIFFVDGNDRPYWTYSITLAAGQTGIIVNFAAGLGTKAAANAKAAALDLLPANTTQFMTAAEKSQILNFLALPPVDVSITKTTTSTNVVAGQLVTFVLTARNNDATNAAAGVTVVDTLPAGMTYSSDTCGVGSAPGGVFTRNIGALAASTSSACNLVVTMGAAPLGPISNTATVSETNTDPTPGNNSSTATVTLLGGADVSVTKTTTATTVFPGQLVTFALTASNAGPSTALNVVVTDTLPAGMTYTSNTCGATFAAGTLTWNVGTIVSGGSSACNLVVTMGSAPIGPIVNNASITASNSDPTPGNNTGSGRVTLGAPVTQIPTLGTAGLLLLGVAFAGLGMLLIRRNP